MGATPEQITTAVSTAFKQTSIPQIATFRPTNDIETDGEKIIETITSFENQCLDLNITDPTEKKRLLLLRQPVFSDINVNIPDPATGNAYDKIKQKILTHYYCHDLKACSKRRLSTIKQKKSESFNDFVKNVRRIATLAEVNDNTVLRDTIIRGMNDDDIGTKIKRDHFINEKNLDTLITDTNNLVFAYKQAAVLKAENHGNQPSAQVRKTTDFQQKRSTLKKQNNKGKGCLFCGSTNWHKKREDCPAFGKECRICKKMNHFGKVCMSKSNKTDNKSDEHNRKPFKKQKFKARKVQKEAHEDSMESEEDSLVSSFVNHMTLN